MWGNVSVSSVLTTDGNDNSKSTFSPGDSILYYGAVYNSTWGTATAYFQWSVDGPCGSIASWSGNLDTGSGTWWWYLPGSIPSNACAGTYTYRLSVTYNGQTSTRSTTFTVRDSGGSVSVNSVWTTDGNDNSKSTFNRGDSIRYYGSVYNSTGRTGTAYYRWSVDGPCGSIASWSGNLSTGSGTRWWYLSASIPSNACAGTYTYRLSVSYNGQTSTRSTTFTVQGGGGSVSVNSVWTTDGNDNSKSTFSPGDSIRYYGAVYNSTGRTSTAYFQWSVDGPCGSIAYWAGNLGTGSGTRWWYLPASIPSNACAGTYTYQLRVSYNGQTSTKSTTFHVSNSGSAKFLTLPFPPDSEMRIQQGWRYTWESTPTHKGIDYIKGSLDNSATWRSFPVVAAADGEACGNCVNGPGNKVWIRHTVGGLIYYTYYGHLSSIDNQIPRGSLNDTVHVQRGQVIGYAGDTGTTQGWVHLHFQLKNADNVPVDPYDLRDQRSSYPDPNGTNGRHSGANHYWTTNPPSYP